MNVKVWNGSIGLGLAAVAACTASTEPGTSSPASGSTPLADSPSSDVTVEPNPEPESSAGAEQVPSPKSTMSIVDANVKDTINADQAHALYQEGCNKQIERVASECKCLATYYRDNLPHIMFALEAAMEAGEDGLASSLLNTMRSLDVPFEKKMGLTRKAGWDACLTEGIPVE